MQLTGRCALITGAGSGIGRALAQVLARRGCHLALADIDAVGVQDTAAALAQLPVRISVHDLDVADRQAVAQLPAEVLRAHPGVDVLINNAGVAIGGTFEEVSEADFEWLFEINFWGVVRMTRAFLPLLRASDDARLVNLSSLFGLVAPPGQAAYAASKFAVRGFSQALRHELLASRVGVTLVHPGGVATAIAKNARAPRNAPALEVERQKKAFSKMLRLPPEAAAQTIVQAIEARRGRVLVGQDAHLLAALERLMPVSYWRLIARLVPRSL